MKKILYTLLLLFVPLSMVGCKIDDGERNDKKTIYGYNMFSYVVSDFSQNYMMIYDVINLNAYITATSEQAKTEIINRYFPGLRIESLTDNRYVIIDRVKIFMSVQTDGKTVDEPGALWKIESYNGSDLRTQPVTIENVGVDSWTILCGGGVIDAKRVKSTAEPCLSFTTVDFVSNVSNGRNTLQCTDLTYAYASNGYGQILFCPVAGWAMVTVNGGGKPENIVEGTFSKDPLFKLELSYRGVTESYDFWDEWYRYY